MEPATVITPLLAALLGVIEGLTEYLPISSTGHLILASRAFNLNLEDKGINAFLIVIQAGAILAVVGLYRRSVGLMLRGLMGKSADGLRLFGLLVVSFIPAAVTGFLFDDLIEARLFRPLPVALALGLGGVAMVLAEKYVRRRAPNANGADAAEHDEDLQALDITKVTWKQAALIGVGQCFALWPGTSRSMATMVAAMVTGLSPRAAAEYSFLLALPTLGAATAYKLMKDGAAIIEASGPVELAIGFAVSCAVAYASMEFLLRYLTKHGFLAFGIYRVILAVAVVVFWA